MKKIQLLITFLFLTLSICAQKVNPEIGKLYSFHYNNSKIISGRVTAVTDTTVTFNLYDRPNPVTVKLRDIAKSVEYKYPVLGSFGAGIGVAYGVFGINGEMSLFDYFSLSAGAGTTIFAGPAFAGGGRIYFRPRDKKWRPRVSAHYGTNSFIYVTGADNIKEKFKGLTLGAGFLNSYGVNRRSGFDFEIVYLASRGNFDTRWEEIKSSYDEVTVNEWAAGRIKILFGYRICF